MLRARFRRLWPHAWTLALVCACVSYEPAPIDVDRLPQAYAERRLDEPGVRRFVGAFLGAEPAAWPPAALDLGQLQAVALLHRPELRAARLQLAQAQAAHEVAAELPNPRVALGPGLVANPGDQTRWLATVGLAFPLDLFGQRSARAEAAASEVAAARIAVARADIAIRADVVERAFAVDLQRQIVAAAGELAALRQRAVALVVKRVDHGAADAGEAALARSAAQRAMTARLVAAREVEMGQTALASALGLPPAAIVDRALSLPVVEIPDLDAATRRQLTEAAVRQRLDVADALCVYARREAELRLEVARQWPDLEIGPGYEYDQGLHKFRFDLGFTLPLFHANDAAIGKAKADRAAAAAMVEAVQTQAINEIEAAARQFARQSGELAAARELVATTAAAVATAQRRAEFGADDESVVIAARIDAVEADVLLVQARHAARVAWLRLEQAVQHPIGPGLLHWQRAAPQEEP